MPLRCTLKQANTSSTEQHDPSADDNSKIGQRADSMQTENAQGRSPERSQNRRWAGIGERGGAFALTDWHRVAQIPVN